MPTPTYGTFAGQIAAALVGVSLDPGLVLSGRKLPQPFNLPLQQFPQINVDYVTAGTAPGPAAVGKANLFAYRYGTLSAAPVDIDLTTLTDPYGNPIAFARLNMILVCNDATTNGYTLDMKPGAATGFAAPFGGTTPVLHCPPGFTDGAANFPGYAMLAGFNQTGYVVDSTHKILTLDPGANVVAYRVFFFGRDA